jgi:hypothetical protein
MLIEAAASQSHDDDDSSGDDKDDADQLSLDSLIIPADWPEGKNWGTLSIEGSCTLADITFPTDLKLLNEARQSTEKVLDDLCKQGNGYGVHRPRYDRGMSSTGSKPFFPTARPGASLIVLSIWCSGWYGPLFAERQGLLSNSEPKSVFLLAMDLRSCIGSVGMPTTKARI